MANQPIGQSGATYAVGGLVATGGAVPLGAAAPTLATGGFSADGAARPLSASGASQAASSDPRQRSFAMAIRAATRRRAA